ncbi:MAG: type II toxin-antitoxin system prevent-host-death family antitoxin [Candidatus Sericytochromatia bacterium]|nr:type II toxin-antitoxin system prevent-host-death family antitoxin [Candidatus Tanganyikabacteria bacterium]
MREVGAYEAKTHLPRLLEDVRKGETIVITKHGVPVAHLVPPPASRRRTIAELQRDMEALRREVGPIGIPIRDLIEEGRRY